MRLARLVAALVAPAALIAAFIVAPAPARAQDTEEAIQRRLQENLQKSQDLHQAKDWDGAIKLYDAIIADAEKAGLDEEARRGVLQIAHYNKACALALKGEKDAALIHFEKSLDTGFDQFDHIAEDSDLDSIRDTPRFKEVLAKHKAQAESARVADAKKEAAELASQISEKALFPFDFDVKAVDGTPVKLADFRGKVLLVDVWGTWCPPCRAEVPHLIELHDALKVKGFAIVGLNWERGRADGPDLVRKFTAEHKIEYPCAIVDDPFLEKIPGFQGFPTLLLVDREGRVRLKKAGYTELAVLRAAVEKLLEEPAPVKSTEKQTF